MASKFSIDYVGNQPFEFHAYVVVKTDNETGKRTRCGGGHTYEAAQDVYIDVARDYAAQLFAAARTARRVRAAHLAAGFPVAVLARGASAYLKG